MNIVGNTTSLPDLQYNKLVSDLAKAHTLIEFDTEEVAPLALLNAEYCVNSNPLLPAILANIERAQRFVERIERFKVGDLVVTSDYPTLEIEGEILELMHTGVWNRRMVRVRHAGGELVGSLFLCSLRDPQLDRYVST